jgi:hypothetical protein
VASWNLFERVRTFFFSFFFSNCYFVLLLFSSWIFKKSTGFLGFGSNSKRFFVLKDNLLLYSYPPNQTMSQSLFGKKTAASTASSKLIARSDSARRSFLQSNKSSARGGPGDTGSTRPSESLAPGRRSLFHGTSLTNLLEAYNTRDSVKRKEAEAEADIQMKFDKAFVINSETVIEELKRNTVRLSSPNSPAKPLQLTFKTGDQQDMWLDAIREVIRKQKTSK